MISLIQGSGNEKTIETEIRAVVARGWQHREDTATKEHEGTLWVTENSIALISVVATSYIKFVKIHRLVHT